MPAKRHWTPIEDSQIAASRLLRRTWDALAIDLQASRTALIEHARTLGIPRNPPPDSEPADEADREPLPAGHPTAWTVLTEGTSLAGSPFERGA